jgi:sialic acid synthase SpsE
MANFNIGRRRIGDGEPSYFIADISANHDGDLGRAKMLVHLAADAGANAAKFQNFRAPKIVSDRGFCTLGSQLSHQAKWKKSVYQVYQDASIPWEWTPILKTECDAAGIDYCSTPYDFEAVAMLDPYVPVFKIGSGDITWHEMLEEVASKPKPLILATGASDIGEVQRAVRLVLALNKNLALMQCNTNYTASLENFRHIHLRVLKAYEVMFPDVVLGLSDHTPGHTTVLGAVALGARMVEKHFTDDTSREGPDHLFSMTPMTWREMVDRTRELEAALGCPTKQVADNERETVVLQRRCLRAARYLPAGTVLTRDDIEILRPSPREAIQPYDLDRVLGRKTARGLEQHDCLCWNSLE